jgi:hypothetical protein
MLVVRVSGQATAIDTSNRKSTQAIHLGLAMAAL